MIAPIDFGRLEIALGSMRGWLELAVTFLCIVLAFALDPAVRALDTVRVRGRNILGVTPGRQHFHPSAAKAWAKISVSGGTPNLDAGYNIASISDDGNASRPCA